MRNQTRVSIAARAARCGLRADWGPAHRRWLSAFSFDSAWQELAFNELRRTIEDRLAQCGDRAKAGALRRDTVTAIVGRERRIPSLEARSQLLIQDGRPHLQKPMRESRPPRHLLPLHKALADHLVDRRLDET